MQIIKFSTKYTLALLAMIVLLSSCEKEYESIENIDDAKINAYILKNNIPAIKDPSGFYYQVLEKGTGGPLLNKDSVFYTITDKSLNGTVYTSPEIYTNAGTYVGYMGYSEGYANPEAYRIATLAVNRGGKVRIIVPSYLAFGKNGSGVIPPNEIIVSEISVLLEAKQWQIDDRVISNFIATKGLTGFTKLPSRVYRNVSVVGTGAAITPLSTITVKYKGRMLNGTVFDESGSTDFVTTFDVVVKGWEKALVGVTKGSKLRFFLPSDLAYGPAAYRTIPGNSILDFDIEVVDVVN